jgi:SARP family transcriptional regulator, regulator of embCAB operon
VSADSPLRVYVCGRLAVESGPVVLRERDFPARQGRRLWVYLLLNRRLPVGRVELAEAVWGDDAPEAADTALNALVSRLRATLRPVAARHLALAVRGEVGRYALTLPPDTFVDAERARLAIHEADVAIRQGALALALAECRVAMEITGRGLLPGEEAPWIEGWRRTLVDIRGRAHERTVEAELARGNPEIAETEARDLIGREPLRESAYRLLMRALAARGNAAEIPAVLARCRQTLADLADLAPSAETERLAGELTAR